MHATSSNLVRTPRSRQAVSIALRSETEIAAMRRAGAVVRAALDAASKTCAAGATTQDVDDAAADVIGRLGALPIFLGHGGHAPGEGFPACSCVSVNDEVLHGVPGRRRMEDGDLVSIDCGVRLDGWCADAAVTVAVGRPAPAARRLLAITESALAGAIEMIHPGRRWSAIAEWIDSFAREHGFAVVAEYVGHGIGRELHEPPQVPNSPRWKPQDNPEMRGDFTLRPGMTLAIEPMFVMGSADTIEMPDGWTVATADGSLAAHFEHTVAVTRDGAEILTPLTR